MYKCMERHEAFTEFLRSYSDLIWSMCRDAAHGDYELCRDLFQDVSLRLWQHFDELRPYVKPYEQKAWVEWQVRHVLNHAKRRQRPEPMEVLPEQPNDDVMDEAEVRMLVNDLLAQLHPDERQMMQMRLEGYSADEIAQATGLKRDAVYQRIHRTIKKARRILLILFLLLVASSITIAVVPSLRQRIFGGGESGAVDTLPVCVPVAPSPAPMNVADSIKDSIVSRRTWNPPEPIPHLTTMADTALPPIPLPLNDPCGCPEGYRMKTGNDSLDLLDDPCEPIPDELPEATIRVVGNIIVVEGVMNELVDVYDTHGRLVATAHCNGRCSIHLRLEQGYPRHRSTTHIFWVHVGNRPRQRVTIANPSQTMGYGENRIFLY